jgi:PAS domain S-box-containing protein
MPSSREASHWDNEAVCRDALVRAAGTLFNAGSAEELVITDGSQHPVGIMTRRDFIRLCVQGAMDAPISACIPENPWLAIQGDPTLARLVMTQADYLVLVDDQGIYKELISKREITNRYILSLDNPLLLTGYGCLLAIIDAGGEKVFIDAGLDTLQDQAAKTFSVHSPLRQAVAETAQGGRPHDGRELEWGGASWMVFTVPVCEGDKVLGAIGLFHHAKDVRAIINRLKRVEQLYDEVNTILETSYDGFTIIDGKGFITRVNKAHARITGSRPENMIGRHVLDCEKDGELTNPVSMMVLQQKRQMTIRQQVKNGKYVTVTGNPVFDADGNIKMVVCNVRDTSEIQAMQEKLLKTEMVYRVELEHMRRQQLQFDRIIVAGPSMRQVMETAEHIADKETSVLVLGETGVGKEVLVKKIHQISSRRDGPFLKINCCAIPDNLLESELFGYEGGAFTGARKGGKPGLLEAARGGTLFLDEIGDISMDLQVKLLRVLQENEIVRVGGLKSIAVDTRFIFATNRDLKMMVAEGRFRKDLYYRLNVVPISIPALRHRKDDIKPFLDYFLEKFNQKHGYEKQFSAELVRALCSYSWPGNVRELENLVERLVVSVYSSVIDVVHIPELGIASLPAVHDPSLEIGTSRSPLPLREALETMEKKLITQALLEHGSMGRAAAVLGVDRTTILRKIGKYGIPYGYQW